MAWLNLMLLLHAFWVVSSTSPAQTGIGLIRDPADSTVVGGGIVKAKASVWCGNKNMASGVTDNEGHVKIRGNVETTEGDDDYKGKCWVSVAVPVPSFKAWNHTKALEAEVRVQSLTTPTKQIVVEGLFVYTLSVAVLQR